MACVYMLNIICVHKYVYANPHAPKVLYGKEGAQDKNSGDTCSMVLPPEKLITFSESVSSSGRI